MELEISILALNISQYWYLHIHKISSNNYYYWYSLEQNIKIILENVHQMNYKVVE